MLSVFVNVNMKLDEKRNPTGEVHHEKLQEAIEEYRKKHEEMNPEGNPEELDIHIWKSTDGVAHRVSQDRVLGVGSCKQAASIFAPTNDEFLWIEYGCSCSVRGVAPSACGGGGSPSAVGRGDYAQVRGGGGAPKSSREPIGGDSAGDVDFGLWFLVLLCLHYPQLLPPHSPLPLILLPRHKEFGNRINL